MTDRSDPQPTQPPPVPPTRRASVHLPIAAFFLFDLFILVMSGRSALSAVVFAGATSVLVGWVLDRRYRDALSRHEHRLRTYDQSIQARSAVDAPADEMPTGSTPAHDRAHPTGGDLISPPVGSWANPSASQRFRRRWDRSSPYAPRRGRRR